MSLPPLSVVENAGSQICNIASGKMYSFTRVARLEMSVVCIGNAWLVEQLGEKQDFEAELSRVGHQHEEFTLHVDPLNTARPRAGWNPRYQVKVTHSPTKTVKTYDGGPRESWVAHFADDLAEGLYGEPTLCKALHVQWARIR